MKDIFIGIMMAGLIMAISLGFVVACIVVAKTLF